MPTNEIKKKCQKNLEVAIEELLADCLDNNAERKLGDYNRKFIKDWHTPIYNLI